ncbi:hypothetical protein D0Z03_000010 [Geotrichum reessii]|nr:hypothetical protein D0Z03_000010 [Galactomyces reessii]
MPKPSVSTPSSKLLTGGTSNTRTSPKGKGGANSISSAAGGSLYGSNADDALLASHAFSPEKSVRRLILERKRAASQLYEDGYEHESETLQETHKDEIEPVKNKEELDVSKSETITNGNGVVTPHAKVNGSKELLATGTSESTSTESSPTLIEPSSVETESSEIKKSAESLPVSDEDDVDEDGYWMSPRAADLENLSLHELRAVKNFVVGRRGIGKIEFLDTVDLSKFKNLANEIFGKVVVFVPRSCSLYGGIADSEEKLVPGTGLNTRTRVSIEGLWPLSRATHEPIKDLSDKAFAKHLEKLKSALGGTFVSFDKNSGTFVFESEPLK